MQEIVQGKIIDIKDDGGVLIAAAFPSLDRALIRNYKTVQIGFCDSRAISTDQRKKIYALLREISNFIGDTPESTKRTMKMEFMIHRMEGMTKEMFSLATVDMNTASEFISYMVEFMLEHDIPCFNHSLADLCDDMEKYVYTCFMYKKCAVCGDKAELHHIDAIGMGSDRQEVHHLGRMALPLCRKHHGELHNCGNKDFMERHHLPGIRIDEKICRKYRLRK